MGSVGYILLLLCLALWGGVSGWRCGLIHQIGSVLGIGFGIGGACFLTTDMMPWVEAHAGSFLDVPCPEYLVCSVSVAIIMAFFYAFFLFCGILLRKLLKILPSGFINKISGCVFGIFKWMFLASVAYNAILGVTQSGTLYDLTDVGDANPVEMVMPLAPTIIGYPGPDELHHRMQLIEARDISLLDNENIETPQSVNLMIC